MSMIYGITYRQMRWVIAAWLTLSTVLNLIDRQTLSILAPLLRDRLHLSTQDYANVVTAFMISYTVMYSVSGILVDRFGERLGMAACMLWWSVCTMLTVFAQGVWSLAGIRFLLGLGEPGNYPAALRAVARWFPKTERGLPIAMFSSGSAVGNVLAPPLIAALTAFLGWRAAFVLPGFLGLVWLVVWLAIYRSPKEYPGMTPEEAEQMENEDTAAVRLNRPSWLSLLQNRNVLALVLSRFVSDPVWYFYVFWIPEYLKRQRGFSLTDIGMYAWMPFVAGALGGMLGGRASDMLIKRGMSPARARTRVLYVSASIAPLGILTGAVSSAAAAMFLIGVMAFVAYSWFINTAALITDVLPERSVGSVLGFVGTAGAAGGALFSYLVGHLLSTYTYAVVFALAGSMHVIGALILWSLLNEKRNDTGHLPATTEMSSPVRRAV